MAGSPDDTHPAAQDSGHGIRERTSGRETGRSPRIGSADAMSYGHAERNLAAVRALTAETVELLRERDGLTVDQRRWVMATPDPPDWAEDHDDVRDRCGGLPLDHACTSRRLPVTLRCPPQGPDAAAHRLHDQSAPARVG